MIVQFPSCRNMCTSKLYVVLIVIVVYLHLTGAIDSFQNCNAYTRNGWTKGLLKTTFRNDKLYCSYTRIPYALPPLGWFRFREPRSMIPWKGVLDATKEAVQCPQTDLITRKFAGSEDCLYLNVYTPQTRNITVNLPVYVWIFGGGFQVGSADTVLYGPDHLVDEDVVLVTFNYRLGPFGFLSLATPQYPGNAGLKDQRLALRWVRENIAYFGGDPRRVTLGGWSAGGVSAVMHILSPNSRGLFHRAIAQSGTPLNPWAFSPMNEARSRAYILGRAMGFRANNDRDLMEMLSAASTQEIIRAAKKVTVVDLAFKPTVEPRQTRESVLDECSLDLLREGKFPSIPILMGFNREEGIYPLAVFNGLISTVRMLEEEALRDLSGDRAFGRALSQIRNITEYSLVEAATNLFFVPGIQQAAKLISARAPVFFYKFVYNGRGAIHDIIYRIKVDGVAHGDEVPYIFRTKLVKDFVPGSTEEITSRRLARLWGNFIKYGDPTPDRSDTLQVNWPRYSMQYQDYLEIGNSLKPKRYPSSTYADNLENYIITQPRGFCKVTNVVGKLP